MTIKCKRVPPVGAVVQIDSSTDTMMARGIVEAVADNNCVAVRFTEIGQSGWILGQTLWFLWQDDPGLCELSWLREE